MVASMFFRKEPFFHGHDNYDQLVKIAKASALRAHLWKSLKFNVFKFFRFWELMIFTSILPNTEFLWTLTTRTFLVGTRRSRGPSSSHLRFIKSALPRFVPPLLMLPWDPSLTSLSV